MKLSRQKLHDFRRVANSILHRAAKAVPIDIHLRSNASCVMAYALNDQAFVAAPVGTSDAMPPITLPLTALDPRSQSDYSIEVDAETIEVAWQDGPIPKGARFPLSHANCDPLAQLPAFSSWYTATQRWTRVMSEATEVTDPGSMRYALSCLQLDGGRQTIAATDGRQLYVAGGMYMPWQDAILLPASRYFLSREFTSAAAVQVARVENWFGIRLDDLVLGLKLNTEGRFPDVASVVPSIAAMETMVTIHPDDNRFLRTTLSALPGGKEERAPVTLDVSSRFTLRASDATTEQATELILSRSSTKGPALTLATQRGFLRQCLALEMDHVYIKDRESPCVAEGEGRTYVWMPYDAAAIVPADAVTLRIASEQHAKTSTCPSRTRKQRSHSPLPNRLRGLLDEAQKVIARMQELLPHPT